MAEKVTTPPASDGPKTITIAIDDLDSLIARRVEAAVAARSASAVPQILTTDQVAFAAHRQSMRWRFVPGVGYTNVPEGHDPVTGQPLSGRRG